MKKPRNSINAWWNGCDIPKHKIPYLKSSNKRDKINPITGKYIGWMELNIALPNLKKTHRQMNRQVIAEALCDLYNEQEENWNDINAEEEQIEWNEYILMLEEDAVKEDCRYLEELELSWYSGGYCDPMDDYYMGDY